MTRVKRGNVARKRRKDPKPKDFADHTQPFSDCQSTSDEGAAECLPRSQKRKRDFRRL